MGEKSFLSLFCCLLCRLHRLNFPSVIQLLLISSTGEHPCTQSTMAGGRLLPTSPALISQHPQPTWEQKELPAVHVPFSTTYLCVLPLTQFAHSKGRSHVLQTTFELAETWRERQCQTARQTMKQRTAFATMGITAGKQTSVKQGISSGQGGRVRARDTSQECCFLGVLGTLQTEPISADFKD